MYFVNVTVHVMAAFVWLGGMLFLGLVGAPTLRAIEPPALRQQLFHTLGMRFRTIGWASIAVLLVTGVLNLYFRGLLRWESVLGSPAFWRTTVGIALGTKLVTVTGMVVLSAVHDFIVGPAAGRAQPASASALGLRRRAAWLARTTALLGIILLIAAVRLART